MLAAENPLNAGPLIFPALECVHIIGITLFGGGIAIVDFRLLGLVMTSRPAAAVARDMFLWTLLGLVLILLSGPVMFATDPDMYYLNSAFQAKMALLVAGLLYQYLVHNRATKEGVPAGWRVAAAALSLTLWFGVMAGAIFIGFV